MWELGSVAALPQELGRPISDPEGDGYPVSILGILNKFCVKTNIGDGCFG
jgi:hypothetical protein